MKEKPYQGPYMRKDDHHIYIEPAKEIRDVVAHYTITYPSAEPVRCDTYHILPDASGCIYLQGTQAFYWGPMQELVMQENDLAWAEPRFFIEFQIGGLYQISGKPLAPYMNHRETLSCFDETIDQTMRYLYAKSNTYEEMITACDRWIIQQKQKYSIPSRIMNAISIIEMTQGNIVMDEVAAQCHISMRQLRRDFSFYIGLSPKQFANVTRINCVVKELSKDELIHQALEGGFFDQAHFNKMFKQILHVTPSHYIEHIDDFYRELYKF